MISIMLAGEAFSNKRRSGAEAQRKNRQAAKPEGEGERGEPTKYRRASR